MITKDKRGWSYDMNDYEIDESSIATPTIIFEASICFVVTLQRGQLQNNLMEHI